MDYQTMKEIPGPDRPYEKCERLGAEALTDAELLSIIIRTGARGEHSLALAQTGGDFRPAAPLAAGAYGSEGDRTSEGTSTSVHWGAVEADMENPGRPGDEAL